MIFILIFLAHLSLPFFFSFNKKVRSSDLVEILLVASLVGFTWGDWVSFSFGVWFLREVLCSTGVTPLAQGLTAFFLVSLCHFGGKNGLEVIGRRML